MLSWPKSTYVQHAMRLQHAPSGYGSRLTGPHCTKLRILQTGSLCSVEEQSIRHECSQHIYSTCRGSMPHIEATSPSTWTSHVERKYFAWPHYKRNPSHRNKNLHRTTCRQMEATSRWTERRREVDFPTLVKERQGLNREEAVTPLSKLDGTCATSSRDKVELLAEHFAAMVTVADPTRPPLCLEQEVTQTGTAVDVKRENVMRLLRGIDVRMVTGPDNIFG
ncbi:hypothetical protein E2C01_018861 [Portunus trituberculatus]|uniref:Uncharacterized protein n=1 Tax=Portunus trituberculatus TaxID=210409 RepID=A0A5B7DXC2_PORTR|nr:hypothetical protein [Portunus trituberculatus]